MAAQLGLESVEELEAAIDSMDGIADDGGPIEGDNLAREARVRSAYLEWCKEYGKDSDESRFQQFMKNFLDMEEFANEAGKEMSLNEYADCTEEEYAIILEGGELPTPAAAPVAEDSAAAQAAQAAAKKAAADEAAAKKAAIAKKAEEEEAAAKKAEEEAKMEALKEKGALVLLLT